MSLSGSSQPAPGDESPGGSPTQHGDAAARSAIEDAAWYQRRWLPLVSQFFDSVVESLWLSPSARVLHMGCGPGALLAKMAGTVGPLGRMVGLDPSRAMLGAARTLARRRSLLNVALVQAEAAHAPFSSNAFDACVHLFPRWTARDVTNHLAETRRVLRPGGRTSVLLPGAPSTSPGVSLLVEVLDRHGYTRTEEPAGETAASDDPRTALESAGFSRTGTAQVAAELRRFDFDDYWADVLAGRLPGSTLYRSLPAEAKAAVRVEVRESISAFQSGTRLSLPVRAVLCWGTLE
jgi:ubiquinone/menaquinone biosynthesis C-methylase UbiE